MRLLVKFPSLGRPKKFFEVLAKYRAMLSARFPVRFVVTLNDDDKTMNNADVRARLDGIANLTYSYGMHRTKVEAVNADVPPYDEWDVMLLASDDMIPVVYGYDGVICSEMERLYPDTDGVLWFNDGFVGRKLNTLAILGAKYYSRTNYIYQPDFRELWCDNEFTAVAERLGKQTWFDWTIIEHRHPGNVGGMLDETYKKGSRQHWRDKALYELRAARGFDL